MPRLLAVVPRLLVACTAVVAIAAPTQVCAQDGSRAIPSPYREIRNGRYVELIGGSVFGNGGPIQVGPQDGTVIGARVVFRAKNTVQLAFGGWTASTERLIVSADDSVAKRISGPVDHRLIGVEAAIQLNLTGGKRWHAFAPHIGVAIGLVKGAKTPAADSSGYAFGSKFFFGPNIGTKIFFGQRLFVKAEARALLWKLNYPISYTDEPAGQPGTPESPNGVNPTGKRGEYTLTPAVFVGLGWAF